MSKITSISTAVPPYKQTQMQIYEVVKSIHADTAAEQRALKFMYNSSGIATRYAAVPDFNLEHKRKDLLTGDGAALGLEHRLKIYENAALDLATEAIENCLPNDITPSAITHLITVSCTGMQAPGLDLAIIKQLGLRPNIYRTSVNFMGCYAAIHGLKQAHYITEAEPDAKVLVICVELCTLHFQKSKTVDNITSTIIFGDGAAAVLVEGEGSRTPGWDIKGFYSEINFEGIDDMAWKISADGFLMTLTNKVPDILEAKCQSIIDNALTYYGVNASDIPFWCVHPGGRKILESIEKGTFVTKEQLAPSYEILKAYGNMSSPTVLFVLDKICKMAAQSPDIRKIVGMAFGPGLTLETFYLQHA
ncbi:type III polyketide synthase [Niabella insulamsoli]|uniref:type III polyketide synthase n=1 Tax=Niabella insulamsoli TaxID=3144874 RepID=UPI0031FC7AF7